jgi:hypothetical protein
MERFFAELDGLLEPEIKPPLEPGTRRNVAAFSSISAKRRRSAKELRNRRCGRWREPAKTRSTTALVVALVSLSSPCELYS